MPATVILFLIFFISFLLVKKEEAAFVLAALSGIMLGSIVKDVYLIGDPVQTALITAGATIFIGVAWWKRRKLG